MEGRDVVITSHCSFRKKKKTCTTMQVFVFQISFYVTEALLILLPLYSPSVGTIGAFPVHLFLLQYSKCCAGCMSSQIPCFHCVFIIPNAALGTKRFLIKILDILKWLMVKTKESSGAEAQEARSRFRAVAVARIIRRKSVNLRGGFISLEHFCLSQMRLWVFSFAASGSILPLLNGPLLLFSRSAWLPLCQC